jgi:putative ABC transport system substrate-binding protein
MASRSAGVNFAVVESVAKRLGIGLFPVVVTATGDLPSQFAEMRTAGVDAFVVLAHPSLDDMRDQIAELGLRHSLPGVAHQPFHVRAGLLLSYGASLSELHGRAAGYVDKILKGEKPGDLPVEQAERFRLAVNLKTAAALGLDIPPSLLARADEVIE